MPLPAWVRLPLPPILLATVMALLRLKIREPLSVTVLPVPNVPLVPLPACSVLLLPIVVLPVLLLAPLKINVPA